MHAYALDHVADDKLLADLSLLVAKDRQTTAALLAHIAEVDARELYKPVACSTMHGYCVQVLRLSEDAAFKRLRAARAGRRFPQIFAAIADGRVHLSGVVMLAPHFTGENVDALIAAATHRSKADIELLLAQRAPQPDVPTRITPIDPPSGTGELPSLAPGPVERPAPPPATRARPLSPEKYALQVTIDQATRDKLDRAQALLRHSNPSGELAEVIDRALDALLAKLEKQRFGATARPRATKARSEGADPHYIPNDVRRAVYERDGKQCTFVSAEGVRCRERGFLQLDHRTPVALGGRPTVDNVRLLCEPHNQYEAEQKLGADFMRAKRELAKAARANRRATTNQLVAPGAAPASAANRPAPREDGGVGTGEPARADFDDDVSLALRGLGFKPTQVSAAMVQTADTPAATFEERIRAALAALRGVRGSRCSEAVTQHYRWAS